MSEKYSGAANLSAIAERGGDEHGDDAAGDERADRGDRERRPGPTLARHLVAVQTGHHRGRLAGYVDEDRRRRASVLRAVVDAGQHDHRGGRRKRERDRQQHRRRGQRADAGQHADQRSDHRADEAEQHVDRREGDAQPEAEVRDQIHRGHTGMGSPRST
jgi:hypothetical protein